MSGSACRALALLAMAVALSLTAAPAGAKPRSQAPVAARLAKGVTAARTPAGRYRGLLAVAKALHVGVYRGSGKPIARGAERGPKDLYVYDFTLRLIAGALAQNTTTSAEQLAAELTAATAPLKRRAITADSLRSALRASVRWAGAHPRSRAALVPLLLRGLGRRSTRTDLARPPAASALRLDAAQSFVVAADLAGAISNRARRAAKPRSAVLARPAGLCDDFKPLYEAYETGKTAASLLGGIPAAVAGWIKDATVGNLTTGVINAGLIDQLVDLTSTSGDATQYTHYGPGPHSGAPGMDANLGGRSLQFRVRVQTSAKYPDVVAQCGYLAGINLPLSGGVRDVPVTWQDSATAGESLADNGVITRQDGTTDEDGDALAEFTPANERLRGIGTERYVGNGFLHATVNLQQFLGGKLLSISPNFWAALPPKRVLFHYQVAAHRPAGYAFRTMAAFDATRVNLGQDPDEPPVYTNWKGAEDWSGYVCGDDPTARWQITGALGAATFQPWHTENMLGALFFDGLASLPFDIEVTVNTDLGQGPPITVRLNDTTPASVTVTRGSVPWTTSPLIPYIRYTDTVTAPGGTVNLSEDTTHCLPQ